MSVLCYQATMHICCSLSGPWRTTLTICSLYTGTIPLRLSLPSGSPTLTCNSAGCKLWYFHSTPYLHIQHNIPISPSDQERESDHKRGWPHWPMTERGREDTVQHYDNSKGHDTTVPELGVLRSRDLLKLYFSFTPFCPTSCHTFRFFSRLKFSQRSSSDSWVRYRCPTNCSSFLRSHQVW